VLGAGTDHALLLVARYRYVDLAREHAARAVSYSTGR
jgi:uncharacterized membrane protein YdfJ with MMPL/SSD domain